MQSTVRSHPSSSSSIKTIVETPHPGATAESPKISGKEPQAYTPRTMYDENIPDSGCGSQASSASVACNSRAGECSADSGPEQRPPKEGNLRLFNTRVDEALVTRFNFIQPTIEFLLLERLRRTSLFRATKRHQPMAVRLCPVGTSELDAKLCIVILCAPKIKKMVQDFFDADKTVMSICKPDDASLPSFDVVALGKEPRLCNGETTVQMLHDSATNAIPGNLRHLFIEVPDLDDGTLCGTPIILQADMSAKRATLGGVVMVKYDNGELRICGLTTGHAARACCKVGEEQDEPDSECADDSNNDGELAGSGSPLHSQPTTSTLEEASCSENSDDRLGPWRFQRPEVLGTLLLQSNDCQPNPRPFKGSYDWALFELGSWKPNRLPSSMFSHERTQYLAKSLITEYWTTAPAAALTSGTALECMVAMCGSSGTLKGSLVLQPARILVDTGSMFVDAYMITLDGGNGMNNCDTLHLWKFSNELLVLCNGDSGAWVVSAASNQVIGHVVATDPFGNGYVIPLCDIFHDIEQVKGIHTVSLPTSDQANDQTSALRARWRTLQFWFSLAARLLI